MTYAFAIHIPIAGLSLIPVLFGLPLLLLPMHIVFLELMIDPACSVVFESGKEANDIMSKPPRDVSEKVFSWIILETAILQGLSILIFSLISFYFIWYQGEFEDKARTTCFVTLIIGNTFLVLKSLGEEIFFKLYKDNEFTI